MKTYAESVSDYLQHGGVKQTARLPLNEGYACLRDAAQRTCSGLLYKLPNFFKFNEFNQNSYDYVAEELLVHNC